MQALEDDSWLSESTGDRRKEGRGKTEERRGHRGRGCVEKTGAGQPAFGLTLHPRSVGENPAPHELWSPPRNLGLGDTPSISV